MPFYSRTFKRLMDAVPGKQYLGIYRFLPFFFVLGAALEFSMINWHVGNVNFYQVYKRRQAEKVVQADQNGSLPVAGSS